VSTPTNISQESEGNPQPDVLILPAEYFFVETVEVPPSLAANELADFAELSMEAIAPFPLDHLRWGFLTAPDGQSLLIYAAFQDRLKRAGYAEIESYTWVLPDFASLYGARFDCDTEVLLLGKHYNTSFIIPSGESLPEQIQSLPQTDQASSHQQTKQCIQLKPLPIELSEKGTPIFKFEAIGNSPSNGHWSPLEPDESILWQADIRPGSYKTLERNARRTTTLITRILGYAALFAALLILLEGLLFIGQIWNGTRQKTIDAQATNVRRIEDQQSLMNKLEQVAKNELRPIAILRAANEIRAGLGNTGIEYDETVIEGNNRITIEGKANTINELNAYTEALGKSGIFELVEPPKSLKRAGQTKVTFTVTLNYTHQEAVTPEPASNAPEATPITSNAGGDAS
jgi:Tfp pilus assembly protein PilN